MTICLVTDRRRLAGGAAALPAQIEAAIEAGIDFIQIRERDLDAAPLARLVADAVRRSHGTSTKILVNDRLDVALSCGADGVHLRGDSIPIAAARQLAPTLFLIGRSVHSAEEARRAAGADYLVAGTVWPTSSKPDASRFLGPAGLRAIVDAAPCPVLAIGGISLDRIAEVAGTGAAGIAAVALLAPDPLGTLPHIVAQARRAFDSRKTAP